MDEVAAAEGIHRSVAFEHLELLARVGLLTRESRAGFRGRPARTYRFAGQATELSYPQRQHRLLAGILAEAIAGGGDPMRVAETHGRQLALTSRSESEAIARLGPLGADYELSGKLIKARNCVFEEACVSARDVVCGVQAGLLRGALAAAGSNGDVVPRGPNGSGGCNFELR